MTQVDVGCLVFWKEDWFRGRTCFGCTDPKRRFKLQGANDPRLESLGFHRAPASTDKHLYRFFQTDPGFVYFPKITLQGNWVIAQSIKPDAFPREVYIRWPSYSDPPPDVAEWEGDLRNGYYRYISIDALEKIPGTITDWSITAVKDS